MFFFKDDSGCFFFVGRCFGTCSFFPILRKKRSFDLTFGRSVLLDEIFAVFWI